MTRSRHVVRRPERGAALVVALVLLTATAIIGAAGYLGATSESRAAIGWNDRQRALFLAESALKEADAAVRAFVAGKADVASAVRNAGNGYYVRADGTVPAVNPWPTSASIAAAQLDSRASAAHYIIIFEGMAPAFGEQLVGANGATQAASSQRARFTVVARASGVSDDTGVVLSMSQEYSP